MGRQRAGGEVRSRFWPGNIDFEGRHGAFAIAEFNAASGIVYDGATGTLYVSDAGGNTVRALRGLP
jgi:hypothetical protein